MAQTPVVENVYPGNGIRRIFDLTWPYLDESEVFVSVDGIDVPYTLLAGTTASVELAAAPELGSVVRVYRSTRAVDPLHTFSAGTPFLPRYVDENSKQLLYALQEGVQDFERVGEVADEALAIGKEALEIATDASTGLAQEIIDRQRADANQQGQMTGNVPLLASAFSEISWHGQVIQNSVDIPPNKNAWSFGPTITVAPGQVVRIGEGSHWTIASGGAFVSSIEFASFKATTNTRLSNLEGNYLPAATFNSYRDANDTRVNNLIATAARLPYQGQNASLFGDSITNYGLWIPAFVEATGLNILHNTAIAGAPWSMVAQQITADSVLDSTVINIWCGINDYFYGVPLGTIADANAAGANTFYKHVWAALDKCMTLAPRAKLFVMSPMKSAYVTGSGFTYPQPNGAGHTLEDYRVAMRIMADRMGASFIDMFAKSQMTLYNNAAYTSDTIHPNALGGAMIGKIAGLQLNAG